MYVYILTKNYLFIDKIFNVIVNNRTSRNITDKKTKQRFYGFVQALARICKRFWRMRLSRVDNFC